MAPGSRLAERRRDAPFRSTAATTFTRAARIGATFAARLLTRRAVGATRATAEVAETQDMVCVLVILRLTCVHGGARAGEWRGGTPDTSGKSKPTLIVLWPARTDGWLFCHADWREKRD